MWGDDNYNSDDDIADDDNDDGDDGAMLETYRFQSKSQHIVMISFIWT